MSLFFSPLRYYVTPFRVFMVAMLSPFDSRQLLPSWCFWINGQFDGSVFRLKKWKFANVKVICYHWFILKKKPILNYFINVSHLYFNDLLKQHRVQTSDFSFSVKYWTFTITLCGSIMVVQPDWDTLNMWLYTITFSSGFVINTNISRNPGWSNTIISSLNSVPL